MAGANCPLGVILGLFAALLRLQAGSVVTFEACETSGKGAVSCLHSCTRAWLYMACVIRGPITTDGRSTVSPCYIYMHGWSQ